MDRALMAMEYYAPLSRHPKPSLSTRPLSWLNRGPVCRERVHSWTVVNSFWGGVFLERGVFFFLRGVVMNEHSRHLHIYSTWVRILSTSRGFTSRDEKAPLTIEQIRMFSLCSQRELSNISIIL